MGSEIWKHFVKANKDDFSQTGTAVRDGKTYPVYTYNAKTSDGKISMPTLQKNNFGEEFYILGDKTFDKKASQLLHKSI